MSRLAALFALIALIARPARGEEGMRTSDGKHSLANIEVTLVYFVPKDRVPLADWADRAGYFARRIQAFHRREFDGQSNLRVAVASRPFRSARTSAEVRGNDPNETYDHTMTETRETLGWPGEHPEAFPILLVLSDINWRELDDFRRVRVVDGKEVVEGNISAEGRHFPGAESGGSRASYWANEGFGLGLVSADGWRVPYSGSDCVAYHEGVGHSIGLPHPEPIDGSVMGVAQYQGWINQTFVNLDQKRALGWTPAARPNPARETLFTAFTALPVPITPKVGKPVKLQIRWPGDGKHNKFRCRIQTELAGPWTEVKTNVRETSDPFSSNPPSTLVLPPFPNPTPVSYRIDATLRDGQAVELWGYFQVK